ncbi:MAG: S1C family serine protease [Chloroflexia bacterium]
MLSLLLSACGDAPPTVTPIPTPTVPPTSTVPAVTPTTAAKSPEQIARDLRPATVWVKSTFGETAIQPEGIGAGTGIVYDLDKGYILTNAHVVEGASAIQIYQANSTRGRAARVLGRAECDDLAVLKVDDTSGLAAAPLGDSTALDPGAPVVALGYPQAFELGNDLTVSAGVVSKLHAQMDQYDDLIQTDAKITHGNSGGPLVNNRGEVVGVNTLGFIDSSGNREQGINFAIAMSYAKGIIKDLQAGKNRNYIGMNLSPNLADYKKYFGTDDGMVVAGVASGSPADQAGIGPSDLILKIEGKSISYQDQSASREKQVCDILRSHTDGDPLKIVVQRLEPAQYMQGEVAVGTGGAATSKLIAIGPVSGSAQGNPTATTGDQGNGGGGQANPTATTDPNQNFTFLSQTDFTKGETGTWDTTPGAHSTRTIANGRFTLALNQANLWAVASPTEGSDLADGFIVATVQPHGAGGRAGVAARSSTTNSQDNTYYCYITQDSKFGCDKEVASNWSNIIKVAASSAITPNAYNKIALVMVGTQLTFQISDQNVAKITDTSLTSGSWGLAADTDDNTAKFEAYYGLAVIGQYK